MPWVKLLTAKHIRRGGVQRTYLPGESVEVGRSTAEQWIIAGEAADAFGDVELSTSTELKGNISLLVIGEEGTVDVSSFVEKYNVLWGEYPDIPTEYSCIWFSRHYPLSVDLLRYGFLRVMQDEENSQQGWDLAAMLLSLNQMACDFGSDAEKEATEGVLGDLRVPLFEASVVWARKTPLAQGVISYWSDELKKDKDTDLNHSFIRALHAKRGKICTLPPARR